MLQRAQETEYININCMDPLGRSALLMAIDNENLEMVELLIEHKVETKEGLTTNINLSFFRERKLHYKTEFRDSIYHDQLSVKRGLSLANILLAKRIKYSALKIPNTFHGKTFTLLRFRGKMQCLLKESDL